MHYTPLKGALLFLVDSTKRFEKETAKNEKEMMLLRETLLWCLF